MYVDLVDFWWGMPRHFVPKSPIRGIREVSTISMREKAIEISWPYNLHNVFKHDTSYVDGIVYYPILLDDTRRSPRKQVFWS